MMLRLVPSRLACLGRSLGIDFAGLLLALRSLQLLNILPDVRWRISVFAPRALNARANAGSPGRRLGVVLVNEWCAVVPDLGVRTGKLNVPLNTGVEELLHVIRHGSS